MKTMIKQWLRNSVLFEPLQAIRFRLQPIPRRSMNPWITQLTRIPVQADVEMEVYRIGPPVGHGPGASLYVHGEELLRFDCFGGSTGHFHINLTQARCCPRGEYARLYFPEGTVTDHIERAAFELRRNFEYARRMNRRPCIRACAIEQSKLDEVAETMKKTMKRLDRQEVRGPNKTD